MQPLQSPVLRWGQLRIEAFVVRLLDLEPLWLGETIMDANGLELKYSKFSLDQMPSSDDAVQHLWALVLLHEGLSACEVLILKLATEENEFFFEWATFPKVMIGLALVDCMTFSCHYWDRDEL